LTLTIAAASMLTVVALGLRALGGESPEKAIYGLVEYKGSWKVAFVVR
jgi:hypothetical protein